MKADSDTWESDLKLSTDSSTDAATVEGPGFDVSWTTFTVADEKLFWKEIHFVLILVFRSLACNWN